MSFLLKNKLKSLTKVTILSSFIYFNYKLILNNNRKYHLICNHSDNNKNNIYNKISNDNNNSIDNNLSIIVKSKQNKIFIIKSPSERLSKESIDIISKMREKDKDIKDEVITREDAERIFSIENSTEKNIFSLPKRKIDAEVNYILVNKFGDIEYLSKEDFEGIAEGREFNFFSTISIGNSIHSILKMNDNDFCFIYYINDKEGEVLHYNDNDFKMFRRLYSNLNFSNISYYLLTYKNSQDILKHIVDESSEEKIRSLNKGMYLLRRRNIFMENENDESKSYIPNKRISEDHWRIKINNEEFDVDFLSNKILDQYNPYEYTKDKNINNIYEYGVLKKILNQKNIPFYLYHSNALSIRISLELFPLFFKSQPFYILYTSLDKPNNNKELFNILEHIRDYEYNQNCHFNDTCQEFINDNLFIVVDNKSYSYDKSLVKTGKNKHFQSEILKNTNIIGDIEHWKPLVTKKLITNDFSNENLYKFIRNNSLNEENIEESQFSILSKKKNNQIQLIDSEILKNLFSNEEKFIVLFRNFLDENEEIEEIEMNEKFNISKIKEGKTKEKRKIYSIYNTKSNVKTINDIILSLNLDEKEKKKYKIQNLPFGLFINKNHISEMVYDKEEFMEKLSKYF